MGDDIGSAVGGLVGAVGTIMVAGAIVKAVDRIGNHSRHEHRETRRREHREHKHRELIR